MKSYYFDQLLENGTLPNLLEEIHWTALSSILTHQKSESFQEMEHQLLTKQIDLFIFPLSSIPFDRNENTQLAALSSRRDELFYLQNNSDIKNLAFLGESHTIHYNLDIVKRFIQEINRKVVLLKVPVQELPKAEIAIHLGTDWTDQEMHQLSAEEFVPMASSGIYCLICRKDDTDKRKSLASFHHTETMEISNIERGIQQHFNKRKDIIFMGAHIEKDAQAYFHGTVCISENNANQAAKLNYFHHSQSTTHQFLASILQKMA